MSGRGDGLDLGQDAGAMSGAPKNMLSAGLQLALERQRAANVSAISHFDAFRAHRQHTTSLLTAHSDPERSLCVLGAGNAYDLELELLLEGFATVHLVDLDADALATVRARVPAPLRSRLFTHAPVDLSGMFHDIERFARLQVTPDELVRAPANGVRAIASALPGPFDVVASTCLLTQLQLSLLQMLGDRHRLFVVLRELLSLTHLRTLAALTKPAGHAVLVTDLCETSAAGPSDASGLTELMCRLVEAGHVVHSSHPGLIEHVLRTDPVLSQAFHAWERSAPWIWSNGPEKRFIVYGFSLERAASPSAAKN